MLPVSQYVFWIARSNSGCTLSNIPNASVVAIAAATTERLNRKV